MEREKLYPFTQNEWKTKIENLIGDKFIIIPIVPPTNSHCPNIEEFDIEILNKGLSVSFLYAKYEEFLINNFTGRTNLHNPDSKPIGQFFLPIYLIRNQKQGKETSIDELCNDGIEICTKYNLPYFTMSNGNKKVQLLKCHESFDIKELDNSLNTWELIQKSIRTDLFEECDVISYFEGFYGECKM
jgi:hypothetical protein